ncbi:hypothetical protein J6590_002593 [Homalodisca vitripennis]|nr:hypothetical protein J6590_002593 [Homalodisca vitripennis]
MECRYNDRRDILALAASHFVLFIVVHRGGFEDLPLLGYPQFPALTPSNHVGLPWYRDEAMITAARWPRFSL